MIHTRFDIRSGSRRLQNLSANEDPRRGATTSTSQFTLDTLARCRFIKIEVLNQRITWVLCATRVPMRHASHMRPGRGIGLSPVFLRRASGKLIACRSVTPNGLLSLHRDKVVMFDVAMDVVRRVTLFCLPLR